MQYKDIKKTEDTMRVEADKIRSQKFGELLKSSIKWNLGALITSCLFFFIWKDTIWARLAKIEDNLSNRRVWAIEKISTGDRL